MTAITREQLRHKMERNDDFALVEVLPPDSYERFHLPGAINIPLGEDFDQTVQRALPNKSQNVVVYCNNLDCDASNRAAETLERLGYARVWDYAGGKDDWRHAGLHVESSAPNGGEHASKAS